MKTQIQFLFKWSREILNNHFDKLREKARKPGAPNGKF